MPVSSGSMWTNCDEVQQAVQPPHGTSDPFSPRIAPFIWVTQDAKSPAAKSCPSLAFPSAIGVLRSRYRRAWVSYSKDRRVHRSCARRPTRLGPLAAGPAQLPVRLRRAASRPKSIPVWIV